MKKWEEQNRLKTYQKKVLGAKSTVNKTPNRSFTDVKSPEMKKYYAGSNASASPQQSNSFRSSQTSLSDYNDFEKVDPNQIPLFKLLKFYGLQQYAKGLISRDFGYDLSKLAKLNKQDLDFLISDLKILPGHRVKFLALVRQIQQICSEIEKEASAIFKENQYDRLPKTAKSAYEVNRTNSQKSVYSNKPKSQGSHPSLPTTVNRKNQPQSPVSSGRRGFSQPVEDHKPHNAPRVQNKKIDTIGFDFFKDTESVDDEFSKALEQILDKYQKGDGDSKGSNKKLTTNQNLYSADRRQLGDYQEEGLLKRVNYSEADHMKKELTHVMDSINSSRMDQDDDEDIIEDESFANEETTNASGHIHHTSLMSDRKKESPTLETPITSTGRAQLDQKLPPAKTELPAKKNILDDKPKKVEEVAPVRRIDRITSVDDGFGPKSKLLKAAAADDSMPVRRIDKIKSIDDVNAPKSNVLNIMERNINRNELTADTLNQEIHKIKELYTSFDGAKMTSTLVNIDIEEMCFCLACALKKHIQYFIDNVCTQEYLDFVKRTVFGSQDQNESYSVKELKMNMGGKPQGDVRFGSLMNADKRQILSESTTQLFDKLPNVSAIERSSPAKHRQGQNQKNIYEEERGESFNGNPLDQEESQHHNLNPMQDIDDTQDDDLKRTGQKRLYRDSNEYDQQFGESQEEDPYGYGEGEDEEEEDIDSYYNDQRNLRQQSLAVISERTYDNSEGHSKTHENSEHLGKSDFKHEDEEDFKIEPVQNEEIDNFLRESLRDSMLLSLKDSDFNIAGKGITGIRPIQRQQQPLASMEYSEDLGMSRKEDNEETKLDEEMPSYIDKAEGGQEDIMDFSFESQYTVMADLDSSQLDMGERLRIIFERTYNDKRWNEQEYLKRINTNVDSAVIADYCKSIIITSKMEKEVAIIALIYLERLTTRNNLYLNPANWRNTIFTTLILASKIWDDESYENENFAKAFPVYKTKEINQLEKVLLEILDYDIVIPSSEYAKYYFILRTFAEKNKKSFPLRALDVNTVMNLQRNSKHAAQTLKALYANSLNKTL